MLQNVVDRNIQFELGGLRRAERIARFGRYTTWRSTYANLRGLPICRATRKSWRRRLRNWKNLAAELTTRADLPSD